MDSHERRDLTVPEDFSAHIFMLWNVCAFKTIHNWNEIPELSSALKTQSWVTLTLWLCTVGTNEVNAFSAGHQDLRWWYWWVCVGGGVCGCVWVCVHVCVCVCVCMCVCVWMHMHLCVCSCKTVIKYVWFSLNLLCNMYVTLWMPTVLVWGFWSEFLWVVLS